ncbi:MAG: CRISPR-associated protein Cas7 [Cyclobacteriaceae bacterium]
MEPYIYLRCLRHAEHTVFNVTDGQKTYFDPIFGKPVAYSSGQQIKRSIISALCDKLNEPYAEITYNYQLTLEKDTDKLNPKEIWGAANPIFADQLIGGYMRAPKDQSTVKRRSPLSISAMRPLHPLLENNSGENITFDRSDKIEQVQVKVRDAKGNEIPLDELQKWLKEKNRTLSVRNYLQDLRRTTGLYIYDVAIDLRTLFCVNIQTANGFQIEPEISEDMIEELKKQKWSERRNIFGSCLVCPENRREKIIPALAHALVNWKITSNQARTFSLMETLAIAISDNANQLAGAIRAKLDEDNPKKAIPLIDETSGADLFITTACGGYIPTNAGSNTAIDEAEKKLIELLKKYDYENQLKL